MKMNKLLLFILIVPLMVCSCNTNNQLSLYDLRCENLDNPLAIDSATPHFSWKIFSSQHNVKQEYYEIQVAGSEKALKGGDANLWQSGKVASDASVLVPYQGAELHSRDMAYWRVRVWDNKGNVSQWSEIQRLGIGILSAEEWQGEYIGIKDCKVPQLRRKFEVKDKTTTRLLHINSLGYHEIYLNGKKVTDNVLSPAVSEIDTRSLSVTYDITPYVKRGENDLVVWLGRGWYRKTTFPTIAVHDGPLAKVELNKIIDGKAEIEFVSDSLWCGRESEYGESGSGSWYPSQFGGDLLNGANKLTDLKSKTLDKLEWCDVWVADVPKHKVTPQMCEPNRLGEPIIPKEIRQLENGDWLVDLGRCINGWLQVDFPAMAQGNQVSLKYGDHLDDKGNVEYPNGNGPEHEDIYIAAGSGDEVFCNKFNHHAFQYVVIRNLPSAPESVVGLPLWHNFESASTFDSSDKDMVAIYSMVEYTFKTIGFSGYIVDCPHIERMGYGGDGNASCRTFQSMYEGLPLYRNWLQMWEDAIQEDGGLPHCVPNPYRAGGGPYWCAFVVMAPWQCYLNYGDIRMLERYYPLMKKWFEYVDKYTVDGLLQPWPNLEYRNWYLGDWLAPKGVDYKNKNSVNLISNCVISQCLDIMSKIATLLGDKSAAEQYDARRTELNKLIHKTFYNEQTATYATASQIDMTYPLTVGVVPEECVADVEQALFEQTASRNGHIGVGLVGVTILTDWATDNQQTEFMYSMLKKREYPGYLYMIDNGATTNWEYWHGGRSRIHNCFNGVGSWFVQALGGILTSEQGVGYKSVIIRPQLPAGVEWVKSSKTTPYGEVRSSWRVEDGRVVFEIEIPANSTATFFCPYDATECEINTQKVACDKNGVNLGSGKYEIVVNR